MQKVLLGMPLNHKVSLGRLSVLFSLAAGFKTAVVDGQEFGATVRDFDYVVGLINQLGLRPSLQTLMETYGMPSSSSPLHFLKDDRNAPRWVSTKGMRRNIIIWISGDPQLAQKDPWWRAGKKGSKAPGTIFPVLGELAGFIFYKHIDMSDNRNGWLHQIYNADGVLKAPEKNVIVLMNLKYATSPLPSVNLDGGVLKGVGSPIVLTAYKARLDEIKYTDDPPLHIWDLGLPKRKGVRKDIDHINIHLDENVNDKAEDKTEDNDVVINIEDKSDLPLEMIVGKRLKISLATDPSTGMQWQWRTLPPAIEITPGAFHPRFDDGRCGGGGKQIFTLTASVDGDFEVQLFHARQILHYYSPDLTLTLKVRPDDAAANDKHVKGGSAKEMCNRGLPEDFTDVLSQDVAEWWRYTFRRFKIRGDNDTFYSLSQKAKAFIECMEYIQQWRHDYLLGMPLFVYFEHLSAETEQALREQGRKGGGAWFPGVISKVNVSVVTVDEKATKVQSLTRQGGRSSLQSPNNQKVVPKVIKAVVSQVTVNFEDMQSRTVSTNSIIIDDGQERWGDGVQTCCRCTSCAEEAAELMNTDSQQEVEEKAPVKVRLCGWTGCKNIVTDNNFKSIATDKKFLTSFSGRFGAAAVITEMRAESVNPGDRGENEREHGSADQMLSADPASGGDERQSAYSKRFRKQPFRYSARD